MSEELYLELKRKYPQEVKRIKKLLTRVYKSSDDVNASLSSEILSRRDLDIIIEAMIPEIEEELEDTQITTKTILGCAAGFVTSIAIVDYLWSFFAIFSATTQFLLMSLVIFICYYCNIFFANQSVRNNLVLASIILSAMISSFLGIHHISLLKMFGIDLA